MIFFPNKVLKRYTYTEEGRGLYDEPKRAYEYVGDVLVDFQNESVNETLNEYGTERHNTYKIYFDIDTVILDNDELRDDEGNRYLVIGNIRTYSHFIKYKKAELALRRDKL